MRLRYTRHARNRMRLRRISEAEVEAVLRSGSQPRSDAKGNVVYVAHPAGRYIKVVADQRTDPWTVITAADCAVGTGTMTTKREYEPTIEHDRDADAIYVRVRAVPYSHGKDLDDSRRVDYGEDGQPIGIELLNVSLGVRLKGLPEAGTVRRLLEGSNIAVRT